MPMTTYRISKLAERFNLSRSTLLYYERIGLLTASLRTPAGYRTYTREDGLRLERICMFRSAGLALADIQTLMAEETAPRVKILENRLQELEDQILSLRQQQHTLVAMLNQLSQKACGPVIDKDQWVNMLEAAGMDEAAMARWHGEFERRAPKTHKTFLLSLGIKETEAAQIQDWARTLME